MQLPFDEEMLDNDPLSLDDYALDRVALEGRPLPVTIEPYRSLLEERLEKRLAQLPPVYRVQLSETPLILPSGIKIVGQLDGLCDDGLLVSGKGDPAAALRAWPALLPQSVIQERPPHLIWSHSGKSWRPEIEDPKKELDRYVAYLLYCRQKPSPLSAQVAHSLLKGKQPPLGRYAQWLGLRELGRWRIND